MRRITESVTCTATSARPSFHPLAADRPDSLRAVLTSTRVARRAGTRPKSSAVTNDTAAVKAKVRRSGFRSSLSELLVSATVENSAPLPHQAIATATAPPVRASSTAFGQQLSNDSRPAGADGHADADLATAGRAPGQQQVGQIGAGDEQDDRHHDHQHGQRLRKLSAQLTETLLAGGERQVGGGNRAPIVRRDFSPALLRQRLPEENGPTGFGLFEADALVVAAPSGEPTTPTCGAARGGPA